jgi:hypothetical protein
MAHYAKVEDGVVTQVIVADSKEWCQANLGGEWIQTSYNTHGGVNPVKVEKHYTRTMQVLDTLGMDQALQPHNHIHLGQRTQILICGKRQHQSQLMISFMTGMKQQPLGLK